MILGDIDNKIGDINNIKDINIGELIIVIILGDIRYLDIIDILDIWTLVIFRKSMILRRLAILMILTIVI